MLKKLNVAIGSKLNSYQTIIDLKSSFDKKFSETVSNYSSHLDDEIVKDHKDDPHLYFIQIEHQDSAFDKLQLDEIISNCGILDYEILVG